MKKILRKIKNTFKGGVVIFATFLLFPFAKIFLQKKHIWIITERECEARDNGYAFFKYMRCNHKEINCFYAINDKSPDYNKILQLGNCLKFGSLKHLFYFCGSEILLSSTTQGFCPSWYLTKIRTYVHLPLRFVFLQHGITKDDLPFLYKKNAKLDLFICGGYPEYQWVKDKFNYKGSAQLTGFSRFDNYFGIQPKRQILIMPTWRRGVGESNFKESQYFLEWMKLINSEKFNEFLISNKYKAYFYIHPLFQKYSNFFTTKFESITIAKFDSFDIQKLIFDSSVLITDFSSIYFDFAYMKRSLVYFQFDKSTFFNEHYSKGYFDCERDGFGKVVLTEQEVVDELNNIEKNGLSPIYLERIENFFYKFDNNNCERIYRSVKSYLKDY